MWAYIIICMHFDIIVKLILILFLCVECVHALVRWCEIQSLLTCDGDFSRPLGRSLQHCLFGRLQVSVDVFLRELKHLLDYLKHLGPVLLPDFHPFLHGHDDVLGFVFGSMFRALLYGTCRVIYMSSHIITADTRCDSNLHTYRKCILNYSALKICCG